MDLFADAPLTLPDADLRYLPHWLDAPLASAWLLRLEQETPWEQPILRIHGEEHPTPRLVAWYGDPDAAYRYSGQVHRPLPWTALLGEIRERVEREVGQRLNGVLLNYYRDGQDSMGWHSDDEPELRRDPLVASLSLGGSRRFDLRRKGQTRIAHSLELTHGSLLVMRGATQHHWQHQVAKTRRSCMPRLNLTFRLVYPSHERRRQGDRPQRRARQAHPRRAREAPAGGPQGLRTGVAAGQAAEEAERQAEEALKPPPPRSPAAHSCGQRAAIGQVFPGYLRRPTAFSLLRNLTWVSVMHLAEKARPGD